MPKTIYLHRQSGLYEYEPSIQKIEDETFDGDDNESAIGDDFRAELLATADNDKDNYILSNEMHYMLNRQPTLKAKFMFVTRAHLIGIVLSDFAFPSHTEVEQSYNRATTRASHVVKIEKPLSHKEKGLVIGAVGSVFNELKFASDEIVKSYFGFDDDDLDAQTVKMIVSRALCDDNFLFRVRDPFGMARSGAYRHPSIPRVMGRVILTKGCYDLYAFLIYFFPYMPEAFIALTCTALRASLDEYAKGSHEQREFSSDQYGPIFDDMLERWNRLEPLYAAETRKYLATTVRQAMTRRTLDIPDMLTPALIGAPSEYAKEFIKRKRR